MDIRDIKYFLSVASTGRLRDSAEACDVSQSALSKSIQRLEQEFGLQLFGRSTAGMQLTPAGQMFLTHARRMNADYFAAAQHAEELRAGRAALLRLGATNALVGKLVLPALTELVVRRPTMRTVLSIEPADTLFQSLRAGQLDIVVAATFGSKPLDLAAIDIGGDKLVTVVRSEHPLPATHLLEMSDLVPYSWILTSFGSITREALDTAFLQKGLPTPIVSIEVGFMSPDLLRLLRRTDLIALSPASLVGSEPSGSLRVLELPELTIPRHLSIFTRHQSVLSPLARELIDGLISSGARRI